jgi:hypothetical protein
MSQQELLKETITALESAGIDYMLTGSLVSSLQGEPRLTHDIDLVVKIRKAAVDALARAFPPGEFHLDKQSIYEAISSQGMFNIIDIREGDKIDFWLLTDSPFDRSRFARKYAVEFMGLRIYVSSPEDTIMAKLRWAKLGGGSEKHFGDALRVYEVQYGRLDIVYLEEWALKLEVAESWERLKSEAEVL